MGTDSTTMRSIVINLDAAPDRMTRMTELASKEGVSIERLAAIDGRDAALKSQLARYRGPGISDSTISDTDIACMLSHRKAWQLLLNSEDNWLAIFEDDIHIGKDLKSLLKTDWIPEGVNLIKLEVHNERGQLSLRPITTCGDRKLHILGGSNLGAAGYLISRACAKRLLELTEQVTIPVDSIMFDRRGPLMQEILVHQIVPAAVIQEFILAKSQNRNTDIVSSMIRSTSDRKKHRIFGKIVRLVLSTSRKYKNWKTGLRHLGPPGPIPFS